MIYARQCFIYDPSHPSCLPSFSYPPLDVDYTFSQLITTLFYCPTGLAAYILFCRFFVVLLYFSLYIGISAVIPDTEILYRKDYTFDCSSGLPFAHFDSETLLALQV